ncbi:hypothetical protein PR001_g20837 [Phytophthora rubi]|uniref:Uncharacterized protein n=2 Tax=Phytophthora rubi TaxID=129364 RepID=A0A6A3JCI5_9STRA|nr:hypothetical protein PR001_g20837 [Phytophthora rubi]
MPGKRKSSTEDASKVHLSTEDYKVLVDWIEIKENFRAIYGTNKKPKVGGPPKQKKSAAFEDMAVYLNLNTVNDRLPELSGEQVQSRWRTFMKKFRAALDADLHSTGFGLSKREMDNGVTVEEKLERKCPQFSRMKAIFGDLPNIKPAGTLELGVPASAAANGDGEDSDRVDGGRQGAPSACNDSENESDVSTDYGEDIVSKHSSVFHRTHHDDVIGPEHGQGGGSSDENAEASETVASAYGGLASKADEEICSTLGDLPDVSLDYLQSLHAGTDDLVPSSILFDAVQNGEVDEGRLSTADQLQNTLAKGKSPCPNLAEKVFDVSSTSESEDGSISHLKPAATAVRKANSARMANNKSRQTHRKNGSSLPRNKSASQTAGAKRSGDSQRSSGSSSGRKNTRTTKHQRNLSLAEAHLNVSLQKQEMQQEYLYDQLEFNKQKWAEEKAEKLSLLQVDRERREHETSSRKAGERHELFIALVKQNKSTSEIKELLQIYDQDL